MIVEKACGKAKTIFGSGLVRSQNRYSNWISLYLSGFLSRDSYYNKLITVIYQVIPVLILFSRKSNQVNLLPMSYFSSKILYKVIQPSKIINIISSSTV